ncbi:DNA-binding protein P3A2-like isoform X1 [Centruroides sculpturatus]|uniref:DNA-binding protein P3A2-like isoform X1 n=1 Tax=Centruroides sculpturatus TaxID=218467 RepID=UPI000C6CF233|nr:DNA-binding protein P3A2-like isoform X1 [Centruroides sculpturatus]XP_023234414.1 DNA-binding protein P3A2-like isoform X1 [Centruroides sculpturatus]
MNSTAILTSGMNSTVNHTIIVNDEMSDGPSSPESPSFDDSDLLSSSGVTDDVTAQLAAAGPVGVAAAAAVATGKKRKRPHSFETNPSIRKRQQTRLLSVKSGLLTELNATVLRVSRKQSHILYRKLKATIDEYTTRVGQQAIVLIVTPGKPQNNFKVFGAHPLENVVRNCRGVIMQELEAALAQQAPPQTQEDPTLHELPPLVIDGIPTPVEKMTQAQLRAFIPLMLKYSTGRGKPGWGKETTRPVWWPKDLPWANVRSDARSEEEKQKVSWTHALREIVINCYKYHGREDLLPAFTEDDDKDKVKAAIHARGITTSGACGTASSVAVDSALAAGAQSALYAQPIATHYAPTVVQTINNPDGTVSIIHMDPNSAVVTLSDGTQAQVRTVSAIQNSPTDAEVASQQVSGGQQITPISAVNVDLNGEAAAQAVATLAEATLNHDGQIILTGEDGTQSAFPVSGMVTIPVSMYQTVVTNISQLSEAQAHGMQVTMAPIVTEGESGTNATEGVEVLTVAATSSSTRTSEQS